MHWLALIEEGLVEGKFSPKEMVALGKTIPDGLKVLHPMLRLEMNRSTSNVEVQHVPQKQKDEIDMPSDIFNDDCFLQVGEAEPNSPLGPDEEAR